MPPPLDGSAARRLRREAFSRLGHRMRRSWSYVAPGFEQALAPILSGAIRPGDGDLIWRTAPNHVWKLTLPSEADGAAVVLKESRTSRHYRYLVAPTPTAREAAHYIMLKQLGFPVAEMLAAGDVRTNGRLEKSFIVTRFMEGFSDGRSLPPGDADAHDAEVKDAFIRRSLEQLARFHRIHFYHKGFKSYNVMWRETASPEGVELRLIDFASCRFRPKTVFPRYVVEDLAIFFASLNLSPDAAGGYLDFYRGNNPGCGVDAATLLRRVIRRREVYARR